LFPAAQAEPGLLEGEDRGESKKGPIGKWKTEKAGVEGGPDQGVPVETLGSNWRKD